MKKYITFVGLRPTAPEGATFTCEAKVYAAISQSLPEPPCIEAGPKKIRKLAEDLDHILNQNVLARTVGVVVDASGQVEKAQNHCCRRCQAHLERQLKAQTAAARKFTRFLRDSGGYRVDEGAYITLVGHYPRSERGVLHTIKIAAFDELNEYLDDLKPYVLDQGSRTWADRVSRRLDRDLRSSAVAEYLAESCAGPCQECDGCGCLTCDGTGDQPFTLTLKIAAELLQFLVNSRGYHLAARWRRPSQYRMPRLSKGSKRRLAA